MGKNIFSGTASEDLHHLYEFILLLGNVQTHSILIYLWIPKSVNILTITLYYLFSADTPVQSKM